MKQDLLWSFSLRLGGNVRIQDWYDHRKSMRCLNNFGTHHNSLIAWRWCDEPLEQNPGYMMPLDGNIYRGSDIWNLSLEEGVNLSKPRYFEGSVCQPRFTQKIAQKSPWMMCPSRSKLVVLNANAVQVDPVRAGEQYGYSSELLNSNYLAGKTISMKTLEGFKDICSCHVEKKIYFDGD
jgi:hypothetical protein